MSISDGRFWISRPYWLWRFLCSVAVLVVAASTNGWAGTPSFPFADLVREITLSNGMTFLVARRPDVPVFSAYIGVKVGGIDEAPGKSGLAHLLEHMAFKGTPQIGTRDYAAEKVVLGSGRN